MTRPTPACNNVMKCRRDPTEAELAKEDYAHRKLDPEGATGNGCSFYVYCLVLGKGVEDTLVKLKETTRKEDPAVYTNCMALPNPMQFPILQGLAGDTVRELVDLSHGTFGKEAQVAALYTERDLVQTLCVKFKEKEIDGIVEEVYRYNNFLIARVTAKSFSNAALSNNQSTLEGAIGYLAQSTKERIGSVFRSSEDKTHWDETIVRLCQSNQSLKFDDDIALKKKNLVVQVVFTTNEGHDIHFRYAINSVRPLGVSGGCCLM